MVGLEIKKNTMIAAMAEIFIFLTLVVREVYPPYTLSGATTFFFLCVLPRNVKKPREILRAKHLQYVGPLTKKNGYSGDFEYRSFKGE